MVVSLDHLQEHRGTILDRLGEDLQQISVVVEIHQDFQVLKINNGKTLIMASTEFLLSSCRAFFLSVCPLSSSRCQHSFPVPPQGKARRSDLKDIQVLCDLDLGVFEVLSQLFVVRVRYTHELHPALLQVNNLQTT